MKEDPEWLEQLKSKAEHLREWLNRHKQAEEIAPEVKKNLDFTEWQIRTFENRPDESIEIGFPDLQQTLDSDVAYMDFALPMMPSYDKDDVQGTTAFTSSGTADISVWSGRVGDLGTDDAITFSTIVSNELEDLQTQYDKPNEARSLIIRLGNPQTLERFDEAKSAFSLVDRGTDMRPAAANSMRNLLYGLKGDLWQLARKHEKENMNWEGMAERLALGERGGPQFQELLKQEARFSSLISRLTDVVKDREGGSATDLRRIWMELQDYIIGLLGLVQLPSGQS
jgi:hypothetical protein